MVVLICDPAGWPNQSIDRTGARFAMDQSIRTINRSIELTYLEDGDDGERPDSDLISKRLRILNASTHCITHFKCKNFYNSTNCRKIPWAKPHRPPKIKSHTGPSPRKFVRLSHVKRSKEKRKQKAPKRHHILRLETRHQPTGKGENWNLEGGRLQSRNFNAWKKKHQTPVNSRDVQILQNKKDHPFSLWSKKKKHAAKRTCSIFSRRCFMCAFSVRNSAFSVRNPAFACSTSSSRFLTAAFSVRNPALSVRNPAFACSTSSSRFFTTAFSSIDFSSL